MANGMTHSVIGGLSAFGLAFIEQDSENPINPILAVGTGVTFAKLPDLLEPALNNPHHRQFCHSLIVLAAIGYGIKKAYEWRPSDSGDRFLRALALCAGVGYMSHLLLDGFTPRSLPLVGKI